MYKYIYRAIVFFRSKTRTRANLLNLHSKKPGLYMWSLKFIRTNLRFQKIQRNIIIMYLNHKYNNTFMCTFPKSILTRNRVIFELTLSGLKRFCDTHTSDERTKTLLYDTTAILYTQ